MAYHAGCLPQTYTCLQAQKVHDGYRGENGLKDTGYSFLFFSILLSGVSLVSSFNGHLGSPLDSAFRSPLQSRPSLGSPIS